MLCKFIGIFIGYTFFNLPGAVLGFFVGMVVDKKIARLKNGYGFFQSSANQEAQIEFFQSAFSVMGHVAKADGQVTEEEIKLASAMMDRMRLNAEQKKIAQQAFNQGKQPNFPLVDTLNRVKAIAGRRRGLLQFFLELQVSAAFADGKLDANEIKVLQIVARELGYSQQYLQQRLRMQEAAFRFQQGGFGGFGGSQGGYQQNGSQGSYQQGPTASQIDDAYDVLGVAKDADAKAIKRAYRKLMNEHHPDKLSAKGLPPEMMEVAKQKAQEIQAAYELLKKEKDFK